MKGFLLLLSFCCIINSVGGSSLYPDQLEDTELNRIVFINEPGAVATGGTLSCANTTVQITASSPTGGVIYIWSGPNGFMSNFQNPVVWEPGMFILTVLNPENGMTSTDTAVVISDITEPGAFGTGGTLTCFDPIINLMGGSQTPGVNYHWTGPNGFSSTFQHPAVLWPGNYSLVVTNPSNGCTSTATVTVLSNSSEPGATATAGAITCTNPAAQLTGNSTTSGVTYNWTGPNGFSSIEQNPVVFLPGVYVLTVEDPTNGCESIISVTVASDGNGPGAVAIGGTLSCLQSTVQLQGSSPTPNVLFVWFGPNGFNSNEKNPVVSAPGLYFLSVYNPVNICLSVAIAIVDEDPAPCAFGPVAIDDFNNTLVDMEVSGNVLTNDFDPDGSTLYLTGFSLVLGTGGPYSSSVTLPGQGVITVIDPSMGYYRFVPEPGFIGKTNTVEYEVCDSDSLCTMAKLVIEVINDKAVNHRPIGNNDHYQTIFATAVSGTVLLNDFDPDGDTFSIVGGPASGMSNHGGDWALNGNGTFTYIPPEGYAGLDTVLVYEICDATSGCGDAVLTVLVGSEDDLTNHSPKAVDDAYITPYEQAVSGSLLDNDPADPDEDPVLLTMADGISVGPAGTTITTINGGMATVMPDGRFTYVPLTGYSGPDRFTYQICDGITGCDLATAYLTILPNNCIALDISVFLQGPYLSEQYAMRAVLSKQRRLLPGQIPANPLVPPTPPGNPYRMAPWNYAGTPAEETYSGPYIDDQGLGVTDWVLVAFRTSPEAEDQFLQANGLLYEDGHIEFIEPCLLRTTDPSEVWVVIEHRNHVGVMSDTAISIQNGSLTYDFRQTESFRTQTSFGQNQVEPGVFMMFAADADQNDFPGYDINGSDIYQWQQENGAFDSYTIGDFNLNGDVTGQDNLLYNFNNGIFSAVPKD